MAFAIVSNVLIVRPRVGVILRPSAFQRLEAVLTSMLKDVGVTTKMYVVLATHAPPRAFAKLVSTVIATTFKFKTNSVKWHSATVTDPALSLISPMKHLVILACPPDLVLVGTSVRRVFAVEPTIQD
ncbi:MAG: hypothetical protein BVN35_17635 [Proteobacteria bacterium ST_bin11]|nr:MAG: hypothetical protein BVN35_17635 [Proteobacteria bacterium ST_bin11]